MAVGELRRHPVSDVQDVIRDCVNNRRQKSGSFATQVSTVRCRGMPGSLQIDRSGSTSPSLLQIRLVSSGE